MADRFRFGKGPAPEVLSYLDGKTLKPSYHWQDLHGEEHAYAFTVAKADQVAVLTELHEAVEKAIRTGATFEDFKKQLSPKLKSMGWWGKADRIDPKTGDLETVQLGSNRRLKTIYWANTRSAMAAGKWTRFQRTKHALPYLVYRLGVAREHRPHHVARENTILPIDHPFWDTWMPPNGWGCVCWVRQITQAEADSLGGVSETPDIPTRQWVNKRDGSVHQIPEGIDPGWQTNPGKSRHRTLANHLSGKLDTAPPHIRRAAITDLVGSQMFRRVQSGALAGKPVFAPVAMVPETIAEKIGATTRTAFFSTADAAKQIGKRADLDADIYQLVQRSLDVGEIRRDLSAEPKANDFAASALIDGVWWRALFRVTKDGREIFLKSFRRTNSNQLKFYQKRGPLLRTVPEEDRN
ncbi:phage Mu protein F like protein [Roseibium sp. TrichSKD4]|uniref:phage head morphogenesis protein n=1 Tax=Roseibium sp. TrichSKD4 TaxID=744980 RepID=UPI0001E56CAF|nr:phage minor head protein [Roseibium sp. TrichSKD4]EFO33231.1 phage Mu protein F like protein [Roseibium sp. TrichSKD4]